MKKLFAITLVFAPFAFACTQEQAENETAQDFTASQVECALHIEKGVDIFEGDSLYEGSTTLDEVVSFAPDTASATNMDLRASKHGFVAKVHFTPPDRTSFAVDLEFNDSGKHATSNSSGLVTATGQLSRNGSTLGVELERKQIPYADAPSGTATQATTINAAAFCWKK